MSNLEYGETLWSRIKRHAQFGVSRIQRSAFSADALELWIRQYADSLEDPMKRNELVRIADERRANTDRTIVMIDRELAALEGE